MNRFNNNGKTAWGSHRPDTFTNGASRRPNFNIRRNEVFQRQPFDDDELEGRPHGDSHHDDTVSGKLDRLLEKMDKLGLWREETDRRFDNLDPYLSRETEPPLGIDDDDEEYDVGRRRKSGYRGGGIPTWGSRDAAFDDRDRRGARGRNNSGWDPPGNRYEREQFGDFQQGFTPRTSCWNPPHRYHAAATGFDKNQVSTKPPRFDGSDATNWVSRVHYYFDHLMIPEVQRIHYAVMLFDPPASEWVFNYCANIEFVTWQEFLEDVLHHFDRKSFANATMAHTLEFADSQAGRAPQPQPIADPRRPWQSRENRGTTVTSSKHPPTRSTPGTGPSQESSGRAPEQQRLPLIRVSRAEKAERSRLGLCWHCPEKWVMGHVCNHRLLCYADEDDVFEENIDDDNLAEDVESDALARAGIKVGAINAPGFGENRKSGLQDLAVLTGGQVITEELGMNLEDVELDMLGSCKKVTISKGFSTSDYDKKLQERLAKLSSDVVVLKIGGASEAEVGEKKDRVPDALNATKAAVEEGIVPGGGVALLYAAKELERLPTANFDQKIAVQTIQNALKMPVFTIAANAGVEGAVVVGKLLESENPELEYDAADLLVQIKKLLGYKNNYFGVFDPGGGALLKLLLSTLVVGLWFPP